MKSGKSQATSKSNKHSTGFRASAVKKKFFLCHHLDGSVNMSFTRGSSFRFYLQRSPLFEEHHPHKFISDLHFIDIFMDPYADVTGKSERMKNFFSSFIIEASKWNEKVDKACNTSIYSCSSGNILIAFLASLEARKTKIDAI